MLTLIAGVLQCVVWVTATQRFSQVMLASYWSLLSILSSHWSVIMIMCQEPQDVTSSAGERLVLRCRVEDRRGQCQWTKDGFGLGVKTSLPGFPRYRCGQLTWHTIISTETGIESAKLPDHTCTA